MQKFLWDESLSTGVAMTDTHHKELIVAVNDLAEAIAQGKGATHIKKLLMFLKFYAEWHFEHEEQCAAKHQCAIADTNKQAHTLFIQKFGHLHDEYRQSHASEEIAQQIYDELSDWLVKHILQIDTKIGACVRHSTRQSTIGQA